jgi:hypothetical protein
VKFSGKTVSNIANIANIVAGNARAMLTAESGGFPVQFNINPKSVSLAKINSTEGNRGMLTSSFQDALKATSNIRIELKEAHLTGMGVTHLAVNQLIEWATPIQISASMALDLGSARAMESFVKTTASTLTGGTSSESSTLESAFAARMSRPVYYRLPVLLFSWGAVGPRGRNVRVNLEKVTVDYARFDDLGIPVWAKVALTLVEYTPPTPFTNPTSGGISGRTKHMLSQGENVVQIATRVYGSPNAWRTVAEANGIDDPLRLKPGRTLSLPPSDTVTTEGQP